MKNAAKSKRQKSVSNTKKEYNIVNFRPSLEDALNNLQENINASPDHFHLF